MKTYEEREIPPQPVKTQRVCTVRSCDLCGKKAENGTEWAEELRWGNEGNHQKTEVRAEIGTVGRDYGDCLRYDIDLCPECFLKRLIPWIESHGVKVVPWEIDW